MGEEAGAVRFESTAGRWIVAVSVLGSGIAFLEATVVNVALPEIGRDLEADTGALQWTLNGYLVTLSALILLGGSLGDRFGRRLVFNIGVVWFTIASVVCALAPSVELLVAARVLQGVGGALLTPGSLAIIEATFRPEDRARAIGAWSGLGGVAAAIGPLVGGYLVDAVSWRAIFLLNIPLGVFGGRDGQSPHPRDPRSNRRRTARLSGCHPRRGRARCGHVCTDQRLGGRRHNNDPSQRGGRCGRPPEGSSLPSSAAPTQ